ncbi:hypothetical protein BHM03_00058198 [Ensete ventricosum]|nr:hypothetical protein BHM03_00058198 [Ensete ventricosum]
MLRRDGNQGADHPKHPKLQASIGVQLRDATTIITSTSIMEARNRLAIKDLGEMEDEGMMEDAPRKTQLWRIDHNSTFFFKRTPGGTTDDERKDSENLGLVATAGEGGDNLADGLQRFDNAAEYDAAKVGEDAAGLALGVGGWFIGDYAIDVDEEAFDQGDESVEAAGDDAKLPQDLEAPTMLKMMSITESGSRPKWSIPSTSFAPSIRHSGDPKPGTAAGGRHPIGTLSIETDRAIA